MASNREETVLKSQNLSVKNIPMEDLFRTERLFAIGNIKTIKARTLLWNNNFPENSDVAHTKNTHSTKFFLME